MSKIFFKTGTMGSGKTLDLARVIYNYEEKGMRVLVYKPSLDTREGSEECVIRSRALGYDIPAQWVPEDVYYDIETDIWCEKPSVIIVDESQFLTKEEVDNFQKICYNFNIPILFYGLKTTFQGELFEGSKRILEICDDVEEYKAMCHCGHLAKQNARMIDGKIVKDGDVVVVGGNDLYTAVCNRCFAKGRID